MSKENIVQLLPMEAPFPCPICGKKVLIGGVEEWETESGRILKFDSECETMPDFEDDDWDDWFHGHYSMPYVDWLPWEQRVLELLNERYYRGDDA